jgi:hypothetical protein
MKCGPSNTRAAANADPKSDDMRISVRRHATNGPLPRREQLMSERMRAAPVHKLFPRVEQLRIELVFHDPMNRLPSPSPQSHTLYSAASAFFRFACPCADCDGDFDLTDAVTALVSTGVPREGSAHSSGCLGCQGTRFRHHNKLETGCGMQLRFQLVSELRRNA